MPVYYVEQLLVGSCVSHTEHLDNRGQQAVNLEKWHDFRPAARAQNGDGQAARITELLPHRLLGQGMECGMPVTGSPCSDCQRRHATGFPHRAG